MLNKVVVILAALAVGIPSPASADHTLSSDYIAGAGSSLTSDGFGIGGAFFSPDTPPTAIWFTDVAGGLVSARVCQDTDDDDILCEPDEPVRDFCAPSGDAIPLEGFQAKDTYVWVYAGGVGLGAAPCLGAGGTVGVITLQLAH